MMSYYINNQYLVWAEEFFFANNQRRELRRENSEMQKCKNAEIEKSEV